MCRGLPKLKHVEPLSQLLFRLACMSLNVFAPIFGTLFKSSGQMGNWLCVLWKEMNARGLQPCPATFGCLAEGLVINGQPDEILKLICSHADAKELRSFINTVSYATVLSGFAMAEHDKDASMSACQSASCWLCDTRHLVSAVCSTFKLGW